MVSLFVTSDSSMFLYFDAYVHGGLDVWTTKSDSKLYIKIS